MIEERELLEHALRGYESRLIEINRQMVRLAAEIVKRGGRNATLQIVHQSGSPGASIHALSGETSVKPAHGKRALSPETIERMRAGQRKRWANWRRAKNGLRTARKKVA
jgi:hypothetical protein